MEQAAEQIVSACRRLDEKNLIGAMEGNVSLRIGHTILCTPAGRTKAELEPADLVQCDLDGRPRSGQASSEIKLHVAAYRAQPECRAVVHAHPITATVLACKTVPIAFDLVAEAAYVLGPVAQSRFYMPGTDEVFAAVEGSLRDHQTVLLANHGAVTTGQTLQDAVARMETLERVAQMELIANRLDAVKRLPRSAIEELMQMRSN